MIEVIFTLSLFLVSEAKGANELPEPYVTQIRETDYAKCLLKEHEALREIVPNMKDLGYLAVNTSCMVLNGFPT